jgi:hypothetical protein
VCRRRVIRNPSSERSDLRDTVWVIGIIEENNCNNLRIEVLPNRRMETIKDFLMRNVLPNTIIRSDGYPSYPRAVESNFCIHEIINHSEGFINAEGIHTNLIENVWSHLKTSLRSKRGVMYKNMKLFVKEFVVYKILLKIKTATTISRFFLTLIESLKY